MFILVHTFSWGHVNPIGPRACYDEGKRVAETLAYGFQRQDGVDIRVARIFNTYGKYICPCLEMLRHANVAEFWQALAVRIPPFVNFESCSYCFQ